MLEVTRSVIVVGTCMALLGCAQETAVASGAAGSGGNTGGGNTGGGNTGGGNTGGGNTGGSDGGAGVGGSTATPCDVSSELDVFIEAAMAENNIPGLAAGIVTPDGLAWSKGYGSADIAASRDVESDTIFALMSISKVVTATGVMQLVEAGTLDLDADINAYLDDFEIVHPQFPEATITTRQLLTHTSGLAGDDYGVLQLNIKTSDAEVQPLGEMLGSLLTPAGDRYDGGANYSDNAPGTAFAYSSIAISLAGFVAESISGTGFDELTDASIFDSLGMTNTSWRLSPFADKLDEVAVMYNYVEGADVYEDVEAFTFADYPAGSIRSSVPELSRFLAAMINDGNFGGQQILSPTLTADMREVQFPLISSSQAIGWSYWLGERTLLGHGGDDAGASTDMRYDVDTGKGVILLMNVTRRPNTDDIVERLLDESDGCE